MEAKVALQIRNVEPYEILAKNMAECGFRYVAFAFSDEAMLLSEDWERQVYKVGETFARAGLSCIQTHAPYYDLLISAERRSPEMELALLRAVEATKLLGAPLCAVHPRSVLRAGAPRETAVDREASYRENIIAFSPLVEACEKNGVSLGIENLMRYPHAHPHFYSYLAEDHLALIDGLESAAAAAIWDFGHANLVDEDHGERIRALGGRIKGTHVHNNDGVEDCHFPPFLPDHSAYYARRTVDWSAVLGALRSTGYDGYLTLETVFPSEGPVRSYLQYLYDSVCELDKILHNS